MYDWNMATSATFEAMFRPGDLFDIGTAYQAESVLRFLFPENGHIRDKIRQQLQVLKEQGVVTFVNNDGVYRWNGRAVAHSSPPISSPQDT